MTVLRTSLAQVYLDIYDKTLRIGIYFGVVKGEQWATPKQSQQGTWYIYPDTILGNILLNMQTYNTVTSACI